MSTKFLEPGGDSTFTINATNSNNGGFWSPNGFAGTPTIYTDHVHGAHIKSVGPTIGGNDGFYSPAGTCADAGTRGNIWYYCVAKPSGAGNVAGKVFQIDDGSINQVLVLGMTSAGVIKLLDGANTQIGSNGPTLSTGQWYRINLSYTITSTTVNRFELKVFSSDGLTSVGTISATNATLNNIGTNNFGIQGTSDAAYDFRVSDFYIDNSSALTDPGNIWVTAKRPNANGTTNGFTTQIGSGGSGYGTGHSPQVNERAISTTNGWSKVGAGSATTEEYNIESTSAGDIDISAATIIDWLGWVYISSLVGETGNIILNGSNVSQAITSSTRIYTAIKGSATYPAGSGTDIGFQTDTSLTTVSLYDCGVIVAYIPAILAVSISVSDSISSPQIIASFSESNVTTQININTGNNATKYGEAFSNSSSVVLDSCKFYLKKFGTPSGNTVATIYAITGSLGTTAIPTGSALATSDIISASTFGTSFSLITFSFSGANRITLSASTNYAVIFEPTDVGASNFTIIGIEGTGALYAGNSDRYDGASWQAQSTIDATFYVYGMQTGVADYAYININAFAGRSMSVTDTSNISENNTEFIPILTIQISDTSNISENISLFITSLKISILDTSVMAEVISIAFLSPNSPLISDLTVITENVNIVTLSSGTIHASDIVNTSESISVIIENYKETGVSCQAIVSDYKWLSKTLETAQQQSAVRPYYECRIIDDSILGDIVTTPTTPAQGSVVVAPDGIMYAVGLDGSNNVAVWSGDTTALSGAPSSILENVAGNRSSFNHYSISCSDWIAGSYKLDVYFFGHWASGFLTILHYYSMDKGSTWHTDQVVNTTGIQGSFFVSINKQVMWLSAGKPYLDNLGNIISTVFYIENNPSSITDFMIKHQQYLGSGGTYQTAGQWSPEIDSLDWEIHSLDSAYINGNFYITFSGYHQVFDATNQNSNILNHNVYISKIVAFSNVVSSGISQSLWTPPEQVISALSTSSLNENDFIYPSLFYDGKYLWILLKGQLVTSVQNSNGATNIGTSINYLLSKSSDFINFSYPVPVVFSNTLFSDTTYYSFFLLGSYYWLAGAGQLGRFIINNIVADVSNDILSYETQDTQQNPSTINISIGNANNQWRGAAPTKSGYQAIANNKKICLFQGYYNANGIPEIAPKDTFYIDDIQQNVASNANDFSLIGRDFYKNLGVLKTAFAFNYSGIKKCVDVFDGSVPGNWNFNSASDWADGNNLLVYTNGAPIDGLAIFTVYQQTKANTSFAVTVKFMNPSNASGKPIYVYFYYVDGSNWLRFKLDANASGSNWNYTVQQNVAGTPSDISSGTINYTGNIFFPMLFTRNGFFNFNIWLGGGTASTIDAFASYTQLLSNFSAALLFTGLATVALGGRSNYTGAGDQLTFLNFKYLEFDNSLDITELLQKIATKSGIFEYKLPTVFDDYFFSNTNYSGTFTIPNRVLTIGASQTVMKNDMQIDNGEIQFVARINPTGGASNFKFRFIFRNTGLVNNNECYEFIIGQTDSFGTTVNSIEFFNIHSGTSYSMSIPIVDYLHIDLKQYHTYRVSFANGYAFLIIDNVVIYSWIDNNTTSIHTTGYIGFKTEASTKLEVASVIGNVLYNQIEAFSINPGDDLQSSAESLLATTRSYFISDLMGRFKILQLNSTDPSGYTYQDQIVQQQVDNSDKEYVNQVTVIGNNVQAVVQNVTSIGANAIVREEVIVDYKITTYQDALTRANLELVNFNKFNNQYNPTNIMNVGSELYDVVTIINTGNNSSNVNQTVRNYSQQAQVGGDKLNYWQTIQTGTL